MSEFNSFYGGRRGASFTIVRSYSSVQEMVNNFKLGGSYKTVNYDDYVLINTENKNDPDNGKLYRRGYDYTNSMGGAEYIGQIVGPAGPAPHLELTTIDEVNNKQKTEGFEYRKGSGSYAPTENLVPGKYNQGGVDKYNDEITWAYCSVRDVNKKDTTAYIGFKIPYMVVDYTANSVSAYYNRSTNESSFTNQNLVERVDDGQHPFFEKWHISIPKGIKGDTFKNLRIIEANDSIQDYEGKSDDIENQRKILVYDYYHYDKAESGEPVSIFLGDFNIIDDIIVDEEGTITFQYSHDDDKVFNKKFKWIKSISLDNSNGHFTVLYNHDTSADGEPTKYETDLRWVNNVEVAADGTITLKFTNGVDTVLDNKIKWITQVTLDTNGTLTVTYNDSTTEVFDKEIQWITNISLSESGVFTVKYNNGTPDYTTNLKWPTNITIEDDGTIKVTFNNGNVDTYDKYLKIIDTITIDVGEEEGEGTQKVQVGYNTGVSEKIGNPLNYIIKSAISNDYHLLFLYSDPAKRQAIKEAGKNYTYEDRDDWADMGAIKSNDGILIGKHFDLTTYPEMATIEGAISYLQTNYPNGLTGLGQEGKIVTVGVGEENKSFYAFDYTTSGSAYKGWYYLGSFGDLSVVAGKENDEGTISQAAQLPIGGIWFIVKGDS